MVLGGPCVEIPLSFYRAIFESVEFFENIFKGSSAVTIDTYIPESFAPIPVYDDKAGQDKIQTAYRIIVDQLLNVVNSLISIGCGTQRSGKQDKRMMDRPLFTRNSDTLGCGKHIEEADFQAKNHMAMQKKHWASIHGKCWPEFGCTVVEVSEKVVKLRMSTQFHHQKCSFPCL